MGKNSTHAWSITKTGPQPLLHRDRTKYEHHDRAQQIYSQWMSGINEPDIADFFGIELSDVLRDVQHIQQTLPVRTVISHLHDRNRILILRAEGEKYQNLLRQSLETPASEFLKSGVSPTGVLKEFREATGMVEKPGGIGISVTQNTMIARKTVWNGMQIRSPEDLIRAVIANDPLCALTPPVDIVGQEVAGSEVDPECQKDGTEESGSNEDRGGNDPFIWE